MTGPELLRAIRPLRDFGLALARLETIAAHATRVEQGLEAAEAHLAAATAAAEAHERTVATLQATIARTEAAAAEQAAAIVAAAEADAAARRAATAAAVAGWQGEEAEWHGKATAARLAHETLVTALAAEANTLRVTVDELRESARRLAARAASVA